MGAIEKERFIMPKITPAQKYLIIFLKKHIICNTFVTRNML